MAANPNGPASPAPSPSDHDRAQRLQRIRDAIAELRFDIENGRTVMKWLYESSDDDTAMQAAGALGGFIFQALDTDIAAIEALT